MKEFTKRNVGLSGISMEVAVMIGAYSLGTLEKKEYQKYKESLNEMVNFLNKGIKVYSKDYGEEYSFKDIIDRNKVKPLKYFSIEEGNDLILASRLGGLSSLLGEVLRNKKGISKALLNKEKNSFLDFGSYLGRSRNPPICQGFDPDDLVDEGPIF